MKFYEDTPLGPEQIVKLLRKKEGHAPRPLRRAVDRLEGLSGRPDGGQSETYCSNYKRSATLKMRVKLMKIQSFRHFIRVASISTLALAASSPVLHAQAKAVVLEEIIARVNNDVITTSDYAKADQQLHEEIAHDCQGCTPGQDAIGV